MNIIVANNQQNELDKLDIDTIKNIKGIFEASMLVEMFKTFYFNKMILDVTALKNYDNIDSYKTLISGLDADKIIFYLPENTSLCTSAFLACLVKIGIYNFTTNLDGIKYLTKHSNTYEEVKHIQDLAMRSTTNQPVTSSPVEPIKPVLNFKEPNKIIGIKNITTQAGATTFIYMLKKELDSIIGEKKVLALEIDKNDFNVFTNKEMISTTKEDIQGMLHKLSSYPIIIIDLNDYPDESICSEVYYLIEPSIIKLNRLMRKNSNIFRDLKGSKLILNKSLLSEKDVLDFQFEARTDIYYNMPPLDDRRTNEAMRKFLVKAGLITGQESENNNKVFGLFRR